MITISNNLPPYYFRITEGFVVTDKDMVAGKDTAEKALGNSEKSGAKGESLKVVSEFCC